MHLARHMMILLSAAVAQAQQSPAPGGTGPRTSRLQFRTVTVCNDFPSAYHAAVADMNGDRRPDILVLGEPPGTVDWFENPGPADAVWPRHPITADRTKHNIDLAVEDVDRDGRPDVAVASDFLWNDSGHESFISWFTRGRTGQDWTGVRLHAVPTAHRIRWADVDGDARPELIVVPILGRGAGPPGYQQAAPSLTMHRIPRDPAGDPWPSETIEETLTVVHGICALDWNGDGRCDLLTASNQGIHLFISEGSGRQVRWSRRHLTDGHKGPPPSQGSSEVEVGRAGPGRFLAAIEPWHGTQVVVYTPPELGADAPGPWRRQVIDDSFRNGHALACADLDGDGVDEIVAGYRGEGTSLYVYQLADASRRRWERFELDQGGIAAQGCVTSDVNGDGRIDIVAVGGSTHNVRLYLNATPQARRRASAPGS